MNDRPGELPRAMESPLAQEGVELVVVVVGNGCVPAQVSAGVKTVALAENVGIPEGRDIGARGVEGELLFFFDDDAVLPGADVLVRLAGALLREPGLVYVQPRIADPGTGITVRRRLSRLRAGDPERPGVVTVMAEGVVMIRRDAFDAAGGRPGHFFLFHEGVDLAWRPWDRGGTGRYLPDVVVHHPATDPARHDRFHRLNARNRVWLARRNLPAPLVPLNLTAFVLLTLRRSRDRAALRATAAGFRGGHGRRAPMSRHTVIRLTRAGRPPIV
ncbi:glycosyltransferase family 2 protein [Streptomyces filamentosus]|uniref:glycosyltransferase family 2 protein n=1 Tax=Streptomyces filamentosus TaxID=67294 RepID=UPI00123C33F0|nr:glycosyltransferase [Streptomyces filamentosus]KAA6220082.1 glycosyltransferase family 2 protein [Streptomyces filamentosus]